MAKMRLKELRNADVRYISLVDRAATRIPIRVLKRDDKENMMGIDLTSVFKSDSSVTPHVSSLVVLAQKDEAVGNQVQEAVKAHGFATDRVQKADNGETVVFAQADQQGDEQIVRLSEQTLVSVSGLKTPGGWIGEHIAEHKFFPDLALAATELQDRVIEVIAKSDNPQDDLNSVLTSYAEYLNQMAVLPTAIFKMDEAVVALVAKCACQEKQDEKAVKDEESDEEKAKRVKDHPPAEMAPKDEDDDQKAPPEAYKSDVLAALKDIQTSVAGLTAKVEAVATEQAGQKKVLDEVVQKADTLDKAVRSTVTASPVREDTPSNPLRMRVQKDDDPRTGTFDTGMLARNRRR